MTPESPHPAKQETTNRIAGVPFMVILGTVAAGGRPLEGEERLIQYFANLG